MMTENRLNRQRLNVLRNFEDYCIRSISKDDLFSNDDDLFSFENFLMYVNYLEIEIKNLKNTNTDLVEKF